MNRTGLREIGADTFFSFGPGNILASQIAGATVSLNGLDIGSDTTAVGIFPNARLEVMLRALRSNSLLRILAEPNLVALSGHEASFLAGGEFPVPIAQGAAGGAGNVTVQFKEFGVQLNFVPHILDNESIRLEVRPEVSTIDDFIREISQPNDPVAEVQAAAEDPEMLDLSQAEEVASETVISAIDEPESDIDPKEDLDIEAESGDIDDLTLGLSLRRQRSAQDSPVGKILVVDDNDGIRLALTMSTTGSTPGTIGAVIPAARARSMNRR